jgi:hypothetical protein
VDEIPLGLKDKVLEKIIYFIYRILALDIYKIK